MKKSLMRTLVSLLVVLGIAVPAIAAEFKIGDVDFKLGGSLRYDVGYQLSDLGDVAIGGEDSQKDFFMVNPGNSRLNLQVAYGDMTAFVEAAIVSDDITTRHAYLTYDMGDSGQLLIGQTWSLLSQNLPNQRLNADDCLIGAGDLYSGRNPQIRYTMDVDDSVSVSVAIEDNDNTTPDSLIGSYVVDELTPAILGSLTFNVDDSISINPSFLIQQYEMKSSAIAVNYTVGANTVLVPLKDHDLIAWALALNGTIKPTEDIRIDVEGWYGRNVGVFASGMDIRPAKKTSNFGVPLADVTGLAIFTVNGNANALITLRDFDDVPSYGGWFQVTLPVDPVTIYAGAGYQECQLDGPSYLIETELATWGAFVNAQYNITDNFYVQPELAYFDYGNDVLKTGYSGIWGSNDLGSDIFVGLHFQYDF